MKQKHLAGRKGYELGGSSMGSPFSIKKSYLVK